jgi:hypothetical protein
MHKAEERLVRMRLGREQSRTSDSARDRVLTTSLDNPCLIIWMLLRRASLSPRILSDEGSIPVSAPVLPLAEFNRYPLIGYNNAASGDLADITGAVRATLDENAA